MTNKELLERIEQNIYFPSPKLSYSERMATPLDTAMTIGDWEQLKWEVENEED